MRQPIAGPRGAPDDRPVTDYEIGPVVLTVHAHDRARAFLLLHGGAGPASVSAFGDLLAARTHGRVLVPTHPGFDGTPGPVGGVRDLAALYAALLDRLDARDVTVIGNSLGGWVAAELALTGSPRVARVVLVDAVGAVVPGRPVADVRTLDGAELARLSFADPQRFRGRPGGPSPDAVAANMAALFAYGGEAMGDPALLDRLAAVRVPVEVVWGAADRIVDAEHGRAIAAAVPGARFTLLPDAGHLPQLETPAELLDLIG
jgi:pimeloyl-ACP methyl ester carboxylesterase